MKYLSELSKGRNNNLDVIRLTAAILVMYSHAFPICVGNYEDEIIAKIFNYKLSGGSLAVAVFFILSGFLITKSWDNSRDIGKYIKARLLRIWPGLCAVIVILVFVIGPLFTTLSLTEYFKSADTWNYLKNLSLKIDYWCLPGVFSTHKQLSVNGSLWTLTYEVICYLLVAILGAIHILDHKETSLGVLVLFCYLYLRKDSIFSSNIWMNNLSYLGMFFAAGMVFYCYRETIEISFKAGIVALLGCIVFIEYGDANFAIAIFGSYLLMCLAFNKKVVFDKISRYGDFSYGIYIYAFPIQQIWLHLFEGIMNPYLNFVLSLITVVPIAGISWHFIEKRCLRIKEKNYLEKVNNIEKIVMQRKR